MAAREIVLREHLPNNAPLRLKLLYDYVVLGPPRWEVAIEYTPEGHAPIYLGREPLEVFPSPTLIAQAMLLS